MKEEIPAVIDRRYSRPPALKNMGDEQKTNHTPDQARDQGCPVEMYRRARCGRAIYPAPAGVGETPVCLMHSRDPNKSDAEFQKEFERILAEAGEGVADFSYFVFPSAMYWRREFKAMCIFTGAKFARAADFIFATFTQDAHFSWATFARAAYFSSATFTQAADFTGATFTQAADFRGAKFLAEVEFRQTVFEGDPRLNQGARTTGKPGQNQDPLPGPIFSLARFEKPELVVFYQTYLGLAIFHNCDVSKFVFSDVQWRKRRDSGKRMVFDETVDLTHKTKTEITGALKPQEGDPNERNYTLIAELYQQLKKNYDDRRDYWTAWDFHYGEMEMKRLASPRRNRLLRWLHRNLGLAAWYKYASEYGESYARPAVWLLFFLLALFPVFYSLFGLRAANRAIALPTAARSEQDHNPPALSYSAYIRSGAE